VQLFRQVVKAARRALPIAACSRTTVAAGFQGSVKSST
jgi:hypothetical protein